MGSDSSPHILFKAVLQAADCLDDSCTLLVIATKSVLDSISSFSVSSSNKRALINFHAVSDFIGMADDPIKAVRKKDASLVVGIRFLKKQQIDAFVSCGNTGALIACTTLTMPLLPGIKRPALLANLPTEKGLVATLDVGSTVAVKSSFLVQFAYLGAAFQRAVKGIDIPVVGLLNVGVESKKGTLEVREAYECLRAQTQEFENRGITPKMNFIGNIEARDVFKGSVDVLVTDGFAGNVLLKAAEGTAEFIFDALGGDVLEQAPEAFKQRFNKLHTHFDYAEYPGALVCGVEGVVIKVHGTGSPRALFNSILGAADYIKKGVVKKIKAELS